MPKNDVKRPNQSWNKKLTLLLMGFLGIASNWIELTWAGHESLHNGAFKVQDIGIVYHVNGSLCLIQNLEQLDFYGGVQRLQSVLTEDMYNYLKGLSFQAFQCPWPNGIFKEKSQPVVFLLYEGWRYCSFASEDQLGNYGSSTVIQVISGDKTYFGAYRRYTGPCRILDDFY